jgi:hypothetical protein
MKTLAISGSHASSNSPVVLIVYGAVFIAFGVASFGLARSRIGDRYFAWRARHGPRWLQALGRTYIRSLGPAMFVGLGAILLVIGGILSLRK